ncbi:MAG: ATP synthase F0 subunit A, partial [Flavobacterium sp.]
MVFSKKSIPFFIAILIAFLPLNGKATTQDTIALKKEVIAVEKKEVKSEADEKQEKIDEVIGHHVLDGHSFSLFEDEAEKAHYGFSLPIILWDNGIHLFSSSKFHHGESVAESNGNYYFLHHEKIYITDSAGKLNTELVDGEEHVTNAQPLDFS